jgi:hypothetical protein
MSDKTTQAPAASVTLSAAPVLTGHRLAGKTQRQRFMGAVGINMNRLVETHGACMATDTPTIRMMVRDVIANALMDAFGDAATIDKFESAESIGEGSNAAYFEEDINAANVDWCYTDWRSTGVEHSPDCERDHEASAS